VPAQLVTHYLITHSLSKETPMSHAFDPELAPIVEMLPTLAWDDPAVFRQQAAEFAAAWQRPETAVPVEVRDAAVPGPAGAPEVPVRIYVPKTGQEGAYGALVYFHGGGWMGGDVAGNDGMTYTFAAESGAVVVSVDYRLAPENPFPAGLEDCFAAFLWTVENAAELGIDPERVAVGGDSAGANLAAGVSLMARDRGGPKPCFQLLRIPAVDDRLDTPSMAELTDTPIITGSDLPIVWDSYLGGPGRRGGPDVSPYAAPARAEDLTGLPPAYVCVSEFDPLRDEGIAYAQRLVQAGVPTELHLFPGTFHGSFALPGAISHRMNAEAVTVIQRGLQIEELS
jgi:acetyl esterase